ncbi:hypothetical protein PR202_ga18472 [Eleusine coracana subsp. coracana]|uniref:C2 domain-containing protein n=1 Tax=Eleusine coracana subsp. coracana TaxID=191504 RepID=A0AAV5CTV7_ELECO|nr:hypothetical protein QOZ80_4AG0298260 [Eleusine coracana subsp. coracana]GJN01225.1 hypothetical protein PR202_ga18472 [Eleusine coracana subsp. coracana]
MKLAVEICDASELAAKDGSGSCNPLVEVEFDDQRQRTATKPGDRSPYWNETLVFDVRDPGRLPSLAVDVSVLHDKRLQDQNAVRAHTFLGRVRINADSAARSVEEAVLQRYPLEKRGLFSRVSGDMALKIYLIPDEASENEQQQQAGGVVQEQQESVVRSGFAAASSGGEQHQQQEEKQEVVKEGGGIRRTLHAVGAPPPPPPGQTVVMPRPAGPPAPAPAPPGGGSGGGSGGGAYGLVETKPPLPAKMGPRAAAAAAAKIASTYDMVEAMSYLFVSVIKARDLPTKDVTGALDPFVEVKVGNFKGITKHLDKNPNPVWRQTFAFSRVHLQTNQLEVIVKDKDVVKDDFVGRVAFDVTDIPSRVPPDSPLAPQWYRLADRSGEKLRHGEIMLAVWMGTQADEAFAEAWHSDAHSLSQEGVTNTRAKVYYSPKLMYLKVVVIAAQDIVPAAGAAGEKGRPCIAKIQLGSQVRRTRPQGQPSPVWNEEFMFVAAEPFEEPLVVTIEERNEAVGRVIIPVAAPYVPRNDLAKSIEPKWFNLARHMTVDEAGAGVPANKDRTFASKIHLRLSLETAYHVLDEPTHYSSDLNPAAKKLRKGSIGILELGILSARGLSSPNPYCVAKYGPKWVRTRTLVLMGPLNPSWNEQYTWEVFDSCTVLTVAVFNNGNVFEDRKPDQRVGKVRIRLSTLETDRVYTHLYPLMTLTPSGLKKTGELHLAVRFTCTAWANMLAQYGRPLLPKMHYSHPISVLQLDYLRFQAMQMVATRLARAEPPLRREVVEYMLDVDSHMFSLRRSKANFNRITSLFSGAVAVARWMDGICKWKNPLTTILVHVLFLILVCYPELILPTVFLYLFIIGLWNYRRRPRKPPHMDTMLSYAELAHPDELDEEFDTFPTSKPSDVVRMRYDRLRSVAGRVQTVVGDLATQGERAQALLSWRDPRATSIFIMLSLIVAVVLYVTPFQVVAVVLGLYLLRHPRFRSKQPSVPFNFYKRLPAKSDMLL